ncbi:hypothetical protein T484DRAFT_1941580 [Baffinella frigidus]|nr:hypothetical protein T484DRAFT_1941580 [Cryptophyta sp. CCMP2293]
MPSRFLAASSKAALSAARQLAGMGRTRPVVSGLEGRISTWYSLGKSHGGGFARGARPTTSVGQALSRDEQEASYIQALASQGLSTESASRMDFGLLARRAAASSEGGPGLQALLKRRGLGPNGAETPQKAAGSRAARPAVYTAKVVDAASKKAAPPQQGAITGAARPAVYTAKVADAARASSGGGSKSQGDPTPACKAAAYARYVESLASRGLTVEAAARIDRAVCRKGKDMLLSYGGSSKKIKNLKYYFFTGDASSPLRGSKGGDTLQG